MRAVALAVLLGSALATPLTGRGPGLTGRDSDPWLLLTFLFAVALACPVEFRFAGRTRSLSAVGAPLAAGLLVATPLELVLARVLAGLLVSGIRRRTPALLLPDLVPGLAGTGAAVLVARLGTLPFAAGHPAAAGLVTVVAVGAAQLVEAWAAWPRTVHLVAGPAAAVVGIVAVLADPAGVGVLLMGVTGSVVLLAHRGFVSLSERQGRLERLYELSGALADAPTRSDVVGLALRRATDLLRGGYAEMVLAEPGGDRPLSWSLRRGHGVYGPSDCSGMLAAVAAAGMPFPAARPVVVRAGTPGVRPATPGSGAFLAARGVREAVVVPLAVDGLVHGQLMVADPLCELRGFGSADLRLLEIVANHASVALRNAALVDRLHHEARHDELTGLPNRLRFRELIDVAAEEAAAGGGRCSVMLLDFDGFKAINDTLGHQAGDDLLRVLASRLARAAGGDATVARLGGDEFAVLSTTRVTAAQAEDLAYRLLAVFDEPVAVAGTRLRVGGSLGIALGPRQGSTGSDLMRNADIAMYAAKESGSGVRLYGDELVASTALALRLAADLPEAIAADGIDIAVQPIVELADGGLHSVEVLARWRHPQHGEVDPQQLFTAAERSGQVVGLSLRILDRALRLSRTWQDAGRRLRVCVNLAPRWLADPQLPDHVAAALAHHGIAPGVLSLEITERSVIADPNRAMQTLGRLRDLGVHLAVDDFGTGYSSLTYLSRLPVDQLKIDNDFVRTVAANPRDQAIVSSIVHLGGSLGLEVVAEGVVDPAVRSALLRMGCRLGQGYLFTRPLEPQALETFVAGSDRRLLPGPVAGGSVGAGRAAAGPVAGGSVGAGPVAGSGSPGEVAVPVPRLPFTDRPAARH
ncbi:MAG TPA: EAL domain-containing protein [Kineosporiaceae bacterium]|nr:EAL domain-containing protein [Kineosporiaceae bacterium]